MIWQPQWQKEIGVTLEQQKALAEIKSKASAESIRPRNHTLPAGSKTVDR
jgi:hypothetical protein